MAVHENSRANLVLWKPGQSGNPKGRPSGKMTDWPKYAAGIPTDPETGKPFINPETGEPYNRDDMVKESVFRVACDIRRKDCTRAQQTWNAYVHGMPRAAEKDKGKDGDEKEIGVSKVVLYMPDNGRGPKAEDVKAPSDPNVVVPEVENAESKGD